MYNAGIIGCGFIGCDAPDSHAQAYVDCPDTTMRSFIDSDRQKAIAAYKKFKKWHFTFEQGDGYDLVGNRADPLDIVSICTPVGDGRFYTRLHRVWDAVKSHKAKAVYLEKPIAATIDEAQAIIDFCRDKKILLVVNHQRQFVSPRFTFSRGIIHTGTHVFDLIRRLFGEVVILTKTYCTTANGITVELDYRDTDERYFDLDCTRSKERMILKGVQHIVKCLDEGNINQDSGMSAMRDLELCLAYERLFNAK